MNVVGPLKSNKIKGYAVASKAKSPALPNCRPRVKRACPAASDRATSAALRTLLKSEIDK